MFKETMKILFIGDIVGAPGRLVVEKLLPQIKEKEGIGFILANAENAAGGLGITPKTAQALFKFGIDALTFGDHIWDRKEVLDIIQHPNLLRPANMPEGSAGRGWCVLTKSKLKLGVISLQGRIFMRPIDCPFTTIKKIIPIIAKETPNIIIDIHAEATSEKRAMGWFLDGKVSACLGTHTHIQTADEEILPLGTAYITDIGMSGPCDSVIGRKKEKVIQSFVTRMPSRFEVASGDVQLQGVILDIDESSGRARSIRRVKKKLSED